MLTATQHRLVKTATRMARNTTARSRRRAHREAEAWVAAMGATVERWPSSGGLLFHVTVKGFHPATARCLEHAVEHLDAEVASWVNGPATHGPTKAQLAPVRAAYAAWRTGQETPDAS